MERIKLKNNNTDTKNENFIINNRNKFLKNAFKKFEREKKKI